MAGSGDDDDEPSTESISEEIYVDIAEFNEIIVWTIPCFPVLDVEFIAARIYIDEEEKVGVLQKSDAESFVAPIHIKCTKHCKICINNKEYYVLWKWIKCNVSQDSTTSCTSADGTYNSSLCSSLSSVLSTDSESNEEESVEHTVPFKVLGVAHSLETQKHLENCFELMYGTAKKEVEVKVIPEPNNEKDRNAIAVQVDYGRGWYRIGYIASEITQYVHKALQSKTLLDSKIEHIKFRVQWLRPGFYMKLLLTKRGMWEPYVILHSKGVQ